MSGNLVTTHGAGAPAPAPKNRRGGRQTRFLAQSVLLEEGGSSGLIRMAMLTISTVVAAFVGWAAITNVDEIAVTSGEVVPSGKVQSIQHLEGGIIKEIRVRDGDIVDAGQILLRLDPSAALGELEQMRAREAALSLKAERLRAVGAGREPDFSFVGPEFADMVEDQRSIYHSQLNAADNRKEVLEKQLQQRLAELRVYDEQKSTLETQISLLAEETSMREELFKKGLSSKVILLDVKRELNRSKGDLAKLFNERRQTLESLNEVKSRLAELETDARETSLNEMGTVTGELAQVRESLGKLEDRLTRTEIRSPVRGVVKGLTAHTVGGVIAPGAVVLELVPLDEELVIETRINTRDVGHLHSGQPVNVKVMTYDYARYGGITGELKAISASTYLDEKTREPYYKGIVVLDRNYVGFDPEKNRVLPGMTVQADVSTGHKTLLQYLLKPVYASVNQAFRER